MTLLVTVLAIALNDLDAPAALLAAATVALLFALVLMARAGRLTERNVTRGQFWRTVPPRKRPAGEAGARLAHRVLQETWLRFAKGAAVIAIVLAGSRLCEQDRQLRTRAARGDKLRICTDGLAAADLARSKTNHTSRAKLCI